jgi:DNA polymerase-1
MLDLAAISKSAAESAAVENAFVTGRVLQYDADFGCYECAWLDDSIESNIDTLKKHIEVKRKMAGAEFVNVHITLGMKGGRDQLATVKPYQEQRAGKNLEIKERVAVLRNFLANYTSDTVKPIVNLLQEADDSLTQLQERSIKVYGVKSSVIMSGDKDLWMSQGLHCDQKTGRMYLVNGYGKTEYRDVGNTKPKLVGEGTSWFWHQMLHGDTADNIVGLPTLSGRLLNKYLPTKKYNAKRKSASCGEAKSTAILKGVTNDIEAAKRVLEAYQGTYTNAVEMMVEQAFLLWMRRTSDVADCVHFLNESGIKCDFSPAQKEHLKEFKRLALIQIQASEE